MSAVTLPYLSLNDNGKLWHRHRRSSYSASEARPLLEHPKEPRKKGLLDRRPAQRHRWTKLADSQSIGNELCCSTAGNLTSSLDEVLDLERIGHPLHGKDYAVASRHTTRRWSTSSLFTVSNMPLFDLGVVSNNRYPNQEQINPELFAEQPEFERNPFLNPLSPMTEDLGERKSRIDVPRIPPGLHGIKEEQEVEDEWEEIFHSQEPQQVRVLEAPAGIQDPFDDLFARECEETCPSDTTSSQEEFTSASFGHRTTAADPNEFVLKQVTSSRTVEISANQLPHVGQATEYFTS
ncbi:hypothetical protein CVT26_001612 [Gymnopilus dilepis]|uniref:Uncharacterized protein n=1 Tax=Gymnopilus dilepis TaxID=231916 RepID=A0A409VSP9_9AGAR|nr:hypothetical protein CVT26_001612 [Gymnopilus dilepis]